MKNAARGIRIETNPKRVELLAQAQEDLNWEFRAHLKGLAMTDAELDALVHETFKSVSSQIDCGKCANCCKKLAPHLTKTDIFRLASLLGVSEDAFRRQYLAIDGKDDSGRFPLKGPPCPFLDRNRCGVYEGRPEDCRSFPHLEKPDFRSRLIEAVRNCSVCPISFNVMEALRRKL